MKSTKIFIFSAFIILTSCDEGKDKKHGSGEENWVNKVVNTDHGPVREKQVTGDFDEIEVSQAIQAEIIKSDVEKVAISAPENVIDNVLVDISGGELHIHYKKGIRVMNNHNVTAKIYAKDFTKIEANSAAGIVVKDKFVQEKTNIEVSSAGSVSGNLEANDFEISAGSSSSFSGKIWAVDLDIDASSGASMDLSGKAKNAEVSSSSGGSISAKNLVADNLKAEASSGASIDISAASSINAEASSGGSIEVSKKGNVTSVTKQESSGGSVSIH